MSCLAGDLLNHAYLHMKLYCILSRHGLFMSYITTLYILLVDPLFKTEEISLWTPSVQYTTTLPNHLINNADMSIYWWRMKRPAVFLSLPVCLCCVWIRLHTHMKTHIRTQTRQTTTEEISQKLCGTSWYCQYSTETYSMFGCSGSQRQAGSGYVI